MGISKVHFICIALSVCLSSTTICASELYSFLKTPIDMGSSTDIRSVCSKLPEVNDDKTLSIVLKKLLMEQKRLGLHENRHELGKLLNHCNPTKESKVLILGFEGTGSYEPRLHALINSANQCLSNKVKGELIGNIYSKSNDLIHKNRLSISLDNKWSGLSIGPLAEIFKMSKSYEYDWFSFPSEESELLADLRKIETFSFRRLARDIRRSVNARPLAIESASNCLNNYMYKANKIGIRPKVILISHSSGARTLIKFAEYAKSFKFDLSFSIDPVIEAHEAILEVLPQKIGEPARWSRYQLERLLGGNPDYPYSRVWSRDHDSLYKPSNVKDFLSFYQLDDIEGLKIGGDALRFGIQGSRIRGADNKYIRNMGPSGHGAITYNDKVLNWFRANAKRLSL